MAPIGPGRLGEVLGGGSAAVAVAAGQPVGQAQIGQDDPLPQDRVTADRVLEQPAGPGGLGHSVTGPDVDNLVDGQGDDSGHRGFSKPSSTGSGQTRQRATEQGLLPSATRPQTPQVTWLNPGNGDLEAGRYQGVNDEDEEE